MKTHETPFKKQCMSLVSPSTSLTPTSSFSAIIPPTPLSSAPTPPTLFSSLSLLTLLGIYAHVTMSIQIFTSDTTTRVSVVALAEVPYTPCVTDPRGTITLYEYAIMISFKTFTQASPTLSSQFQQSPKLSSISLTFTILMKLLNPFKLLIPGYTALLLTPLSSTQHTFTFTTSFTLSFSQPPTVDHKLGYCNTASHHMHGVLTTPQKF